MQTGIENSKSLSKTQEAKIEEAMDKLLTKIYHSQDFVDKSWTKEFIELHNLVYQQRLEI